jgi:hypothetical protein
MVWDATVRVAAVLVHDDEVADFVLLARLHYLLRRVAAAVDALGIRHEKPHLLQEHLQPAAGVVAGGYHDLGVHFACTRVHVQSVTKILCTKDSSYSSSS